MQCAEQAIPMNGSFRLFVFAGSISSTSNLAALKSFATNSLKPNTYLTSFLRPDSSSVSYHELQNPHSHFLSFCTIFAAPHAALYSAGSGHDAKLPALLARYRDNIYADDLVDQRVSEVKEGEVGAAHKKMGFKNEQGGIVVVRPDGYVGCVVRLLEGEETVKALNEYFGSFCGKRLGTQGKSEVKAVL
jgi:hypothetical protein